MWRWRKRLKVITTTAAITVLFHSQPNLSCEGRKLNTEKIGVQCNQQLMRSDDYRAFITPTSQIQSQGRRSTTGALNYFASHLKMVRCCWSHLPHIFVFGKVIRKLWNVMELRMAWNKKFISLLQMDRWAFRLSNWIYRWISKSLIEYDIFPRYLILLFTLFYLP